MYGERVSSVYLKSSFHVNLSSVLFFNQKGMQDNLTTLLLLLKYFNYTLRRYSSLYINFAFLQENTRYSAFILNLYVKLVLLPVLRLKFFSGMSCVFLPHLLSKRYTRAFKVKHILWCQVLRLALWYNAHGAHMCTLYSYMWNCRAIIILWHWNIFISIRVKVNSENKFFTLE